MPEAGALPPASAPGVGVADDSGFRGRGRRLGLTLFALHLLFVFWLALSNVLLGLALLASPWTARLRDVLRPGASPLLAALAAYVVLLAASVIASTDPPTSVRALSEIFSLCTLLLALAVIRGAPEARRLVDGVILVAVGIAGYGLFQFLIGYGDIDNRIRGPLSHYMTFSGVLLIADLLLFARLSHAQGWRNLWSWGAAVVLNVALLGSLTRSAWVALAVALAVLVLVRAPRLLLLAPIAALVFLLLAPAPVLHRVRSIVDLTDDSNYDRICMARAGMTMVAERPLFGIGPDLVKTRYPLYRHSTAPRYTVPHLHNSFLQLAAERGLPALTAYLALMLAALRFALARFRAGGGMAGTHADLYLGALLALVGFNLAGLFENNWGDSEVQRMALFVLALPYVAGSGEG